jgi:hypothetical protein
MIKKCSPSGGEKEIETPAFRGDHEQPPRGNLQPADNTSATRFLVSEIIK